MCYCCGSCGVGVVGFVVTYDNVVLFAVRDVVGCVAVICCAGVVVIRVTVDVGFFASVGAGVDCFAVGGAATNRCVVCVVVVVVVVAWCVVPCQCGVVVVGVVAGAVVGVVVGVGVVGVVVINIAGYSGGGVVCVVEATAVAVVGDVASGVVTIDV